MVTLDETQMATIDDPGLSTIQESGQHNSFIDTDVLVFLWVFIVPYTFVQSTEGAVCLV